MIANWLEYRSKRLPPPRDSTIQLRTTIHPTGAIEVERLKTKFIAAWVTVALLSMTGCAGTIKIQPCTSTNLHICDLQDRVSYLEYRMDIQRENPGQEPSTMSDQELINEMRRRKRIATYAVPE